MTPDSDGVSLRGDEAKYKLLVNYGTQRVNSSWNQYNPMMRNSDFRLGEQAQDYETALEWLETGNPDLLEQVYTNPSFNEIANYNTALPLMEYAIPDEYFLPPMALSDEDNTRVADIKPCWILTSSRCSQNSSQALGILKQTGMLIWPSWTPWGPLKWWRFSSATTIARTNKNKDASLNRLL